jgi:glycosyltransferase involved in cell wall biosynthesis
MASISVVIVACNEERTIGKVLSAAQLLAHEIIFVDSGSTDKTIEIARQFAVQLYHQDWLGYAKQKNYAIELAKGDWILSLDADEVMTPSLVAEIRLLLESPQALDYAGYRIPRILCIGEKEVKHGGFYPDAQLRLFRRGKGKFNERLVHEAIKVTGPTRELKNALLHMAYIDIQEFSSAMDKYARLSAQEFATTSGALSVGSNMASALDEFFHPWWTLFYRFVIRAGFLDGDLGWQLNWLYSDYVRKKIRYLRAERSRIKSKRRTTGTENNSVTSRSK